MAANDEFEFSLIKLKQNYTGTLSIIKSGAGFVAVTTNEKPFDVYIPVEGLKNALHGDSVEITLTMIDPFKKKIEGRVVGIVSRKKDFYTGVMRKVDGSWNFIPDDFRITKSFVITPIADLVTGNKVIAKINEVTETKIFGYVTRIIGHENDVGVDIMSLVLDAGVQPEFSEELIKYTNETINKDIDAHQREIRTDLSNLPIFTVDPADAKDLDDAVYVKKLPDGNFRLIVCIADVGYYVRLGSPLDEEARRRTTSIYLTDRVIPMLPHKISNDVCSLNAHEEKLCLTSDMVIDFKGNFVDYKTYPSIIVSKKRFSYDQVNCYYDKGEIPDQTPTDVIASLDDAKQLHHVLRRNKEVRGYIDFDIKEPKVIVDKSGKAVDIKIYERGIAQKMIEDFMIAANEAVTLDMDRLSLRFIYRTHDRPNSKKLKFVQNLGNKLGFNIQGNFEEVTSKQVANWLVNQHTNPNYALIAKQILRAMSKAKYSVDNIGHFGLASTNYTHFTSPIRRYPDLIVNQLLWALMFKKSASSQKYIHELINNLHQIVTDSSEGEVRAVELERTVNSMKFAEYMESNIGKKYVAGISTITNFGMFVELENTIEGLIPFANIKANEFFDFDPEHGTLRGRRTGLNFRLGEKILVEVSAASKLNRKIEFRFIEKIR